MPTKKEIAKEGSIAAILDAAVREFSEKGYSGATTRSIAEAAGVSNGLIMKYFESKDRLLCAIVDRENVASIYDGADCKDPYRTFCIYLDYIRGLQQSNPAIFKLFFRLCNDPDIPASVYAAVEKNFRGSPLETVITEAQRAGEIIEGNPFAMFKILSGSTYILLNTYTAVGSTVPDNDALLQLLGYAPKKKEYAELTCKAERLEKDLQLLIAGMRKQYPFIISADLTENTYHLMEWDSFPADRANTSGKYDTFIALGAAAVPDEKMRRTFSSLFNRENLIKVFQKRKNRGVLHPPADRR